MELHHRLENLRERRGLSASEVARRLGQPRSTVALWFSGGGEPRLGEALRLAGVLGCTVAEMVGEAETPDALTADQRAVLDLFDALELSRHEALRRLARRVPPGEGKSPGANSA